MELVYVDPVDLRSVIRDGQSLFLDVGLPVR